MFYVTGPLFYKDMIEMVVIASGLTTTVENQALIISEIKMHLEKNISYINKTNVIRSGLQYKEMYGIS